MNAKLGKRRKTNRDRPDLIANFEKDQPLIRSEVNCTICVSILVDPVTFPCKHSMCLQCFNRFIRETSLYCPLCRLRLSVWSRKAIRENTLVNLKYKERLEKEFSNDTANRKKEMEAMDNNSIRFDESIFENSMDYEYDNYDGALKKDIDLAKPGEIAMDLDVIYKNHQEEFDRQRRAAEEASLSLISQLVEEDSGLMQMSQMESDFKFAQELFKEEKPVLRPRKELVTKSKDSIPPISKNKLKVKSTLSLAKRSMSKLTTQRRHSASTKRNSTGKSFSASNFKTPNTPKSGGQGAKQTRITDYFHESPAPTTTPSLSGSSGLSTSVGCSQVSSIFESKSGNTSDSMHKNNKNVLSPSLAFSHLSINTPPTALESEENLEEPLHEDLELFNSELDNSLFGSPSNQNQNGLDLGVNIEPELENEELDSFDFENLPLSQLSSLSSEATSNTGSERSLDFRPITELYRREEMALKEIRNRWEQEEEDRKMALQLQKSYQSGNSPRGRLAAVNSNKYSIRNWKRKPAARQP